MQQDLFAGAQAVEQRMSASHASPYDILKEERNKVEKMKEESLFGSQPVSQEETKPVSGSAHVEETMAKEEVQPLVEYAPDEILEAATEYF